MNNLEKIEAKIESLKKEIEEINQADDKEFIPSLYLLKITQLDHMYRAREVYERAMKGVIQP